ncbi:MAG: S8 family serine peptidase [Gammaproteobacteria bacterium]|nr:S8 family serine peptidase [Gammaproteobacteria bacterium]
MSINTSNKLFTLFFCSILTITGNFASVSAANQNMIIDCVTDCSGIIDKVDELGGTVTQKYQNINALAIIIDEADLTKLLLTAPQASMFKDVLINVPSTDPDGSGNFQVDTADGFGGELDAQQTEQLLAQGLPSGFEYNNLLSGATELNIQGLNGSGAIVAIIDTGTANNSTVVSALTGRVIGGENFVPGDTEPSATSTANGNHGTQVGTMVAGQAFFLFDTNSFLIQSLLNYMPQSVFAEFPYPGVSVLPLFGTAPDASLYALKVFPAGGGSSPSSRTFAAMDRAITLRKNFNDGMPSTPVNPGCGAEEDPCVYDSLEIKVVNMSLGGGTLYAAGTLNDKLTEKMLEVGIIPVISAGNEGFAAMTGGSPGTGRGALTVGAASLVGNERFLRDLVYGFGVGGLYRPADHHQMATFSSRGPSADGRISVDMVASGYATLVQDNQGSIVLANGTSFSAPATAGAAALLASAMPNASATEIRNALVKGANPDILGDNSGKIDQGAGFIDIPSALNILQSGNIKTSLPKGKAGEKVAENIKKVGFKTTKLKEVDSDGEDEIYSHNSRVESLMPGQVAHFFIETEKDINQLSISLSNILTELPQAEQNAFFGDDVFFKVQDAITHDEATLAGGFINADTTVVIDNPQTGIVRLAVMGDWTNAGQISADVNITKIKHKRSKKIAKGKVTQGDYTIIDVAVIDGTTQVDFELSWKNNWGAYPTDDIDLIVLDSYGYPYFEGATFASPERLSVTDPVPGIWTVIVQGYTVHSDGDEDDAKSKWELRATDQNGQQLENLSED